MPETRQRQQRARSRSSQTNSSQQQTSSASGQGATSSHSYANLLTSNSQEAGEQSAAQVSVNPVVADLPWDYYVDNFENAQYDFDYRSEQGNLSKWLRLNYSDGIAIDVHIDSILEMSMSAEAMVDAMAQGSVGEGGRIVPTDLCPRTTPRLYAAKQSALEAMGEYNLSFIKTSMPAVLFIITMGIGSVGGPVPRATRRSMPKRMPRIAPTISGFTELESAVIKEARTILSSADLATIRAAHAAGETVSIRIGGRLIQYEPASFSGMTMFGENGFLIGKEAFASEQELAKTVLHELYRLSHSTVAQGGAVSQSVAASETQAAFEFAERAAAFLSH